MCFIYVFCIRVLIMCFFMCFVHVFCLSVLFTAVVYVLCIRVFICVFGHVCFCRVRSVFMWFVYVCCIISGVFMCVVYVVCLRVL